MKRSELPIQLDIDSVRSFLRSVTYKDGWEFEVYGNPFDGMYIQIRATVPNAYYIKGGESPETVQLRINSPIPTVALESHRHLGDWILWRIIRVETHEAMEFFKVGGYMIYDPHNVIEP